MLAFLTATRRLARTAAAAVVALGGALAAVPAHAADHEPDVQQREGEGPYEAAAEAMTAAYPNGAETVILTSSRSSADGLAGAGLSGIRGPLLPVSADHLNPATGSAITELGAERALLLGGEAAISATTERDLRRHDGIEQVERLDGRNRIDTAARVVIEKMAPSEQIGIHPERGRTAFLANAWTQIDAVAAAPRAHQSGHPTVLTHRDKVPRRTLEALDAFDTHSVVVVGGPAVIGPQVIAQLEAEGYGVERVAGDTRFETAAAFAEWVGTGSFGFDDEGVVLAHGGADHVLEALVAAVYASAWPAHHDHDPPAPLLLTGRDVLPDPSEQLLADRARTIRQLHVVRSLLGGEPSIAEGVIDAAREAAAN